MSIAALGLATLVAAIVFALVMKYVVNRQEARVPAPPVKLPDPAPANPENAKLAEALSYVGGTALWVAYERHLETMRPDALFKDPYALALAGTAGKEKSEQGKMHAHYFGFNDWPEFHITWMAVRTKFVDDWITKKLSSTTVQLVNLGAGVDTRSYRLPVLCSSRRVKIWDVDMEELNKYKPTILKELGLDVGRSAIVTCDLGNASEPAGAAGSSEIGGGSILLEKLASAGWQRAKPTVWLLEGLLMYLAKDKQTALMKEIAKLSAKGSSVLINLLADNSGEHEEKTYSTTAFLELQKSCGWTTSTAIRFGEPGLNFGRYPKDQEPCEKFSFIMSDYTA